MTIDELIDYAEEKNLNYENMERFEPETYKIFIDTHYLYKIALSALKAHKQGLKMCGNYQVDCLDKGIPPYTETYYTPAQTELDEILGELE